MGYESKSRNVKAKTISYYWLKNYNVSENDELLVPKTKVVSENSKILMKKSQGFSKNDELLAKNRKVVAILTS